MSSENTVPGLDPGLIAAATAAGTAASPAPGAVDPAGAPAAPAADQWVQEARAMWALVGMLKMRYPSVGKVYSDEAVEQLAVAWAPVLERHNITAGKYMIYLVAAGATMPALSATVEAIREDRAAAAVEKAAKAADGTTA